MANPEEVLKARFGDTNAVNIIKNRIDPGHLESDDFIINDVALRIPPNSISIEKTDLGGQGPLVYQVLRSRQSRKIKSGYGSARISFSIIFRVSNYIDSDNLTRLVAGLRATPFCVVYNNYIENVLGLPDTSNPIAGSGTPSNTFRPIMLGLLSMTFQTLGHEDKPDCVRGTFDFTWFNYLPFTNTVAFKSGPDLSRPGYAWESPLWQAFYDPFLLISKPVRFPHPSDDNYSRITDFIWREFTLVPTGSATSVKAAKQLADILKNKPQQFMDEFHNIVFKATGSDNPDPRLLNEGALDTVYRKLVEKHAISPSADMEEQLQGLGPGAITKYAGNILLPVVRKLYGKDRYSSQDLDAASTAAATLSQKSQRLEKALDDLSYSTVEGNFVKILDANAKFNSQSVGGLELYGRKRGYRIEHIHSSDQTFAPDAIINQITISFRNTLSTIPMVGYKYPTLQHVGSMDTQVWFTINARTEAVKKLNEMYDTIDTMTIRYKQVPAGFTNLYIRNDFLSLFGLSEFLTDGITSETIPEMPGRSIVALSFMEAGITSDTKLEDPEVLKQEFIPGAVGIYKEIWNILKKNMEEKTGFSGKKAGFFSGGGAQIYSPSDVGYYELRPFGVPTDGREAAYLSLINEGIDTYNTFLNQVHKEIFDENMVDGSLNYAAIMELEENDKAWEFIPGIAKIKRSIDERNKEYRQQSLYKKIRGVRYESDKTLKYSAKAKRIATQITGRANFEAKDEKTALGQKRQRVIDLGVKTYTQAMRQLFTKIQTKHQSLNQFVKILALKEKYNIDKGLFAYPDFRKQIASVAGLVEERDVSDNTSLMKYDPDCYFWYSLYSGGSSSPFNNIVDSYYITEAKRHSLNIWQNAQGQVGTFFQKTYRDLLDNPSNPAPLKALDIISDSGGVLQSDLYREGGNIKNSTHNEEISLTVVPDAWGKIYTNWYDIKNPSIKSISNLEHSTDMNQLWTGVAGSDSDNSAPMATPGPPSRLNLPPAASRREGGDKGPVPTFYPWSQRPGGDAKGFTIDMVSACLRLGLSLKSAMILTAHAAHSSGWGRTAANFRLTGIKANKAYRDSGGAYVEARGCECVSPSSSGQSQTNDQGNDKCVTGKVRKCNRMPWRAYKNLDEGVAGILKILSQKNMARSKALLLTGDIGYFRQLRQDGWFTGDGEAFHKDGMRRLDMIMKIVQKNARQLNTQRFMPDQATLEELNKTMTNPVSRNVSDVFMSPITESIREFQKDVYNGQAQSMMRAYPTFKLYFVEDDSDERKRLAFDDFFSYNAVQSIRVIKDREIAADVCILVLTNISGILSNRKFRQHRDGGEKARTDEGKIAKEGGVPMQTNTDKENPIASLLLKEGTHIHLRLGFSSDPDRLETVFNGVITDIQFTESEDIIQIIAQSYAIELVQDLKGIDKPVAKSSWGLFGWDHWGFKAASTGCVLEEMMAQPEVLHFGRWDSTTGYGHTYGRELLTNRWTFQPQPADDNIFAPNPYQDLNKLGDGVFLKSLKYVISNTTTWDIFQEMTLRHPNFIASPVPYQGETGQRMTMFFGLPNQLYFAKFPSYNERDKDAIMKEEGNKVEEQILKDKITQAVAKKDLQASIIKGLPGTIKIQKNQQINSNEKIVIDKLLAKKVQSTSNTNIIEQAVSNFYRQQRLMEAKKSGWIKPFRSYHLLTSSQHIIANNIQASARDIANTIVIKYNTSYTSSLNPLTAITEWATSAIMGNDESFTLKLDSALPPEEMKTQMAPFINVTNAELAKRYALGLLCRNLKEVYKGEIIIIGNPKIKPYDISLLFDEYNDMVGCFEVRQVQHIFDQQNGFRTEIKPDMFVQAAEWSLLSSAEALGIVMEGFLHSSIGSRSNLTQGNLGKNLSFVPYMMGHGLDLFGGFLANKIVNYTQLAQPIVMSPLSHHGRPFAGGVPLKKIPTAWWKTEFGEWTPSISEGFSDWWEEKQDIISSWIKTSSFGNTVGDFWNNGGDYPE